MKTQIILASFFFLAITYSAYCQTAHYAYDASGNRTLRWVDVKDLQDPTADTTFKLGKEFWPSKETLVLSDVKVFPNPVAHDIYIVISNLGEAKASAMVYDIQGRPILSQFNLKAHNSLDLTGLSQGSYILLLRCNEEQRVWKLVKE